MHRIALRSTVILVLATSVAWGQPSSLTSRITREIAARWGIAPERITLQWREPVPASDFEFTALSPRPAGWWTITPVANAHADRMIGVRAGVIDTVRLATHPLGRGAVLTEADITDSVIVRWGKPSRVDQAEVEAGWVTRRIINTGEMLRTPSVGPAPLILAGDSVSVSMEGGALSIAMKGVALRQAARPGDRLDVRLAGGRTLSVIAVTPTTVHPIAR